MTIIRCAKCGGLFAGFPERNAELRCTCVSAANVFYPVDPEGDAAYWRARAEKAEKERDEARADVNTIAQLVLNAWNIQSLFAYVDPIQGTQRICDEVVFLRQELLAQRVENKRIREVLNDVLKIAREYYAFGLAGWEGEFRHAEAVAKAGEK